MQVKATCPNVNINVAPWPIARALLSARSVSASAVVQVQQIERDQHDVFGSALEFVLQDGEISRAVGSRHDHLTVDDRGPRVDVPRVSRDLSEAVGPIIA